MKGGQDSIAARHRTNWSARLASLALTAFLAPGILAGDAPIRQDDVLVLRNGDRVSGHVQNARFTLQTSYSSIEIQSRWITEMVVEAAPAELTSVLTVNGDRLSGFLEDTAFRIRTASGEDRQVRREAVERVRFRPRPPRPAEPGLGQTMVLRNGDRLSGRLQHDPVELRQADGQRVRIALEEVLFVGSTGTSRSRLAIRLRSGETVEGTLELEDLGIRLSIGPSVTVYRDRLQMIDFRRATAPKAGAMESAGDGARARRLSPDLTGDLIWIPAGEFVLGSPLGEPGRDLDEGPETRVVLPQGFWLGKHEVTQAEYEAVMGTNPSLYATRADHPVERVGWRDAVNYCRKLTELHRLTGRIPADHEYRLPTEAEWEYACRAGTTTRFSFGDDEDYFELGDYAWHTANSQSAPHPVGEKKANPWGLHDMHGNVWEWCRDGWTGGYPGGVFTNRVASAESPLRVARGGSWLYAGRHCRSANRDDYGPANRCSDVGFRVVLARVASE